jgi:hypothetical protein
LAKIDLALAKSSETGGERSRAFEPIMIGWLFLAGKHFVES